MLSDLRARLYGSYVTTHLSHQDCTSSAGVQKQVNAHGLYLLPLLP